MASLRISSPSAAAAFVLAGLLGKQGAIAEREPGGEWEIVISLDGASRETVPNALHVVRDWLDECGLPSTSITLDGRTHLLTGSRTAEIAATS